MKRCRPALGTYVEIQVAEIDARPPARQRLSLAAIDAAYAAIERVAMEVKRQLDVLDRRLSEAEYLAGSSFTIADMAVWPWYGGLAKGLLYGAGEFLQVESYKNVQRWTEAVGERPAVKRGRMVNAAWGDPANQLHERHDAGDFETRTQDKLQGAAESA